MSIAAIEPAEHFPRLIADVGGTNARFALEVAPMRLAHIDVKACRDFQSLEAAARAYLAALGEPGQSVRHAAIGIANPVVGDFLQMTNHSWAFSISATQHTLGLDSFHVINDFTALAHALPYLPPSALEQIGGGEADPHAPRVLVGAGTGLGVSGQIPFGHNAVALAGEGGHISFSPVDDEEIRLWQFARRRFGHVSAERFLSGPGLELIDEALATFEGDAQGAPRHAAMVTSLARAGDRRSRKAVDLFCAMLGTVAADVTLVLGARGGVYIGGGIVPKLGKAFASSPFRQRFDDKGRFRPYLERVPVFVIHAQYPALIGLSAYLANALAAQYENCNAAGKSFR
ncbi:glucokinase [Cupriavidus basilensis]|uniref:glucokinase n=1 Tax=Cupriavidus basilensis TaxID=68895 RepID=UPI0039F6E2BD